jgi:hypothetical protein
MAREIMFCALCHVRGPVKTRARGSFAVEAVLWLCFCAPGIVYSIWRLTSSRPVCLACGSDQVVSLDSPRARAAGVSPPT